MRFYDPLEGSISLDGQNIKTLNPIAYRSIFGLVSQDTELFNCTIESNISYGVDSYTVCNN
jgi:ATP-binding cassette subfamily B protein